MNVSLQVFWPQFVALVPSIKAINTTEMRVWKKNRYELKCRPLGEEGIEKFQKKDSHDLKMPLNEIYWNQGNISYYLVLHMKKICKLKVNAGNSVAWFYQDFNLNVFCLEFKS